MSGQGIQRSVGTLQLQRRFRVQNNNIVVRIMSPTVSRLSVSTSVRRQSTEYRKQD